jgi:CubicO group peptidase (beta-lactamase class C family)
LTLITPVCASAAAQNFEEIDPFVMDIMTTLSIPGAYIGVIQDGEIVYSKGFGVTDIAEPIEITADTRFPIGSMTKTITAAALGLAAQNGVIDLYQPVSLYLPSWTLPASDGVSPVRVVDILSHNTSLFAYQGDLLAFMNLTDEEIVERISYLEPWAGPKTDAIGAYNNIGFVAAGSILNAMSGIPYAQFIEENIFVPLGMDRSSVDMETLNLDMQGISGHYPNADGSLLSFPIESAGSMDAAGNIVSTGADMLRFMNWFMTGTGHRDDILLSPEVHDAISTSYRPADRIISSVSGIADPDVGFGLGVKRHTLFGVPFLMKGGSLVGASSTMYMSPYDKTGVVVLTNSNGIGTTAIARGILSLLYTGTIPGNMVDYIVDIIQNEPAQAELRELNDPAFYQSDDDPYLSASDIVGTYVHPAYGTIRISGDEETMTATHESGKGTVLRFGNNLFAISLPVLASLGFSIFDIDENGFVTGFSTLSLGQFTKVEERIDA